MLTTTSRHRSIRLRPSTGLAALALLLSATMLLASGCASTPAAAPAKASSTTKSAAPTSLAQVQAQNAATTIDSTSTGSGPVVLFDVSHLEIFGPTNTSELGQSAAVARMRKAGMRVVATHTPYTDEMLKGVSAVIISGNMQPLAESEVTALGQFMNRGGVLLVAVHVAPLDQALLEHFGFGLSNAVLQTTNPRPGEPAVNLVCTSIEKSRLTEGVKSVRVLGAWAIAPQPPARIIVGTGPDAWLDVNGDGKLGSTDIKGPFGMIGEHQIGKGVIIVSGDDAVFANVALASTDNMQLFDNIVKAMKEPQ